MPYALTSSDQERRAGDLNRFLREKGGTGNYPGGTRLSGNFIDVPSELTDTPYVIADGVFMPKQTYQNLMQQQQPGYTGARDITPQELASRNALAQADYSKVTAAGMPQQNIPTWVQNLSAEDLKNPAVQISLQSQGIDINQLKNKTSSTTTPTVKTSSPTPTTPSKPTSFTKTQSDSFNKTPNLDKDQIAKTFSDYGYQASESELKWWASQPNSEFTKLSSNLDARRKKNTESIVNSQKSKLEAQTKKNENIATQNNSVQGSTSTGATDTQRSSPQGSSPQDISNNNKSTSGILESTLGGGSKLYPLGDYSLVKFDNDSTVFVVDLKNKELRPFLSWNAFLTSYNDPEAAKKAITTLPSSEHTMPGGALSDFHTLDAKYGYSDYAKTTDPEFRVNNINKHYGQQEAPQGDVIKNGIKISNALERLKNDPQSGLDSAFITRITQDPKNKDLLAFYVNAAIHGGYTLTDIYKDLIKRQAQEKGDTQYDNSRFIDDAKDKTQYSSTPEGKAAGSDIRISLPKSVMSDNKDLWDTPVNNLPADAFKATPGFKPRTDEQLKADADKTLTDLAYFKTAQLNAQTESEKIVADRDYNNFVKDVERKIGIRLSDNAQQAWGQLQDILNKSSESGLVGSGIESEQIDDYLKAVRLNDQRNRDVKKTTEEEAQSKYYQNYASPDQIKKLDAEDASKGLNPNDYRSVKWGIKPSQDLVNSMSVATLKSKYPNLSDEQINNYRNKILDENGNLRSIIYAKKYEGLDAINKESTDARVAAEKKKDILAEKEKVARDQADLNQRTVENQFSGYYQPPSPVKQQAPITPQPQQQAPIKPVDTTPQPTIRKSDSAPAGWGINATGNFEKFPTEQIKTPDITPNKSIIPQWAKDLSKSDLQNDAVKISLQGQNIDISKLPSFGQGGAGKGKRKKKNNPKVSFPNLVKSSY